MTAPRFTFGRLSRQWRGTPSFLRNRAFGSALTAAEQQEAWDALAYREECRRAIEIADLAFDSGEPIERRRPNRAAARTSAPSLRHGKEGDDIFESIPPPVYVEALTGEPVPPGGGSIRCPLPDHEDHHPSCHVYGEPGRGWHCFACGRGGSAIDLASHLAGIHPRGEGYWQLRRYIAERLLGREGSG